jgi:hypothetical protein
LVDFKVDGYRGSGIKIMATTAADDVKSPAGRIFIILDDDVTINMVEVR